MKYKCAISIDMDPIYHYLISRNYSPLQCTNINAIYDDALIRFLDLFDEYGVKATFFIVAKDMKNKNNKLKILELYKRGHEIANHTLNHLQNFYNLSPKEMFYEINEADKILSDIIGEKIYGFRAPGWGASTQNLEILEGLEYFYDSSIFPSKALFIINWIDYLINKGKLESVFKDPFYGFAPKIPYRPNYKRIWKKGKMNIIELPPSVLPIIQLPFLGTTLYKFGKQVFKTSARWFSCFKRPLLYELHGIELVDYYSEIKDQRLLVKPGLGKKIDEKENLYKIMLSEFKKNYQFVTMYELMRDYNENYSTSFE